MKTLLKAFTIGLMGSLSLGAFRTPAEVSVGVQITAAADFYEPLGPSGVWVDVGTYGRCWRPARVAVGWRPYCDGTWVWTDAGWYWESDEPWAWACYHYGSWVYDPGYGWVWVPGIEWAPAWVYWRIGGGHIGWAPCGPRGVVIAPSLFIFVGSGHFHHRHRPSTVIVNNTTIINQTTEINVIKRESRNIGGRSQTVVINEGPGVEAVQKATGKKFTAVSVQEADRRTSVPAGIKRRANESPDKEKAPKAPAVQEKPKSRPGETPGIAPEKKRDQPPTPGISPEKKRDQPPTPGASPEKKRDQPPAPGVSPEKKKDQPPSNREVSPPPRQAPPNAPPSRGQPEGKGKGKGGQEEKDRGKERGKDRP